MDDKKYPQVSLILSTYNRPDALDLCLQSIANQSVLPDEVVIGDDGSTEETRQLIQSFQADFPVPLIHVWQEDQGFRLAMIRNKAVAASRYDYLIQIDGDLILHRDFVADHLSFARKGHFLKGGRTFLSEELTQQYCQSRKLPQIHFFVKGLGRRLNTLHIPALSRYLASRYTKNKFSVLGCNLSYWKEDFVRINGYDEFFEGWGHEDYDFAHRLKNAGVARLCLKFSGIVYHLWHREESRKNESRNNQYYKERRNEEAVRCEKGYDSRSA